MVFLLIQHCIEGLLVAASDAVAFLLSLDGWPVSVEVVVESKVASSCLWCGILRLFSFFCDHLCHIFHFSLFGFLITLVLVDFLQ